MSECKHEYRYVRDVNVRVPQRSKQYAIPDANIPGKLYYCVFCLKEVENTNRDGVPKQVEKGLTHDR